ncbi:MAG TPA: sulfite exporter TauE/SafE family protein [Burkholderiales bacterium]|nr:sulfite exporter TauE/SafE family protein [Burkholderiales bacterium]
MRFIALLDFITDPSFYFVAFFAVVLTGIAKGGLGLAGGLSVPILSLVISPVQAAAIMLPILVVMDVSAAWAYRAVWDRNIMKVILPAGILGVGIGALVFSLLNDDMIRIVVGLIAVGFVLNSFRKAKPETPKPSTAKGGFWGCVSGLTSFVAHAGAPPLSVYLLPLRLDPALHVGTSVIFFLFLNLAKLVPYFALGLFTAENLGTSFILIPLGALGAAAGIWLRSRLSPKMFFVASYTVLFIIGVKLLYDGIGAVV